jgi:hypothetical protein
MLRARVRPLVHLLPAEPTAPAHAARETALRTLESLPRRRHVTVGLLGWAARPGLTVNPWTLRGVLDALEVLRLELESVALFGNPAVGRGVFDRVVEAGAETSRGWHSEERRLGLSMPGLPRPARIPSAWVGTSLCLLAPLAHRPARPDDEARSWMGPVQSALATLAAACGVERPGEAGATAGARLVQEVFAGCCLVIDATWWSAVTSEGEYAAHPVAPEHCMATTDAEQEGAARCIDDWITQLLGLPRHASFASPPRTPRVDGRRRPWPRAKLPDPLGGRGLVNERVEPLWTPDPTAPRVAAPDVSVLRVPGSFGATWERYESFSP